MTAGDWVNKRVALEYAHPEPAIPRRGILRPGGPKCARNGWIRSVVSSFCSIFSHRMHFRLVWTSIQETIKRARLQQFLDVTVGITI